MKTLFLRHDLRTKNIGCIRKVNDPMKMTKINGNTETEAFIDSVPMFAEGKDVMTSEIVRKRPFKYFFIESIRSRNFAQSTKL